MKTDISLAGLICNNHEKGIDLLLQAWSRVEKQYPDWRLDVYGDGDTKPYCQQMSMLGIDSSRCALNERTNDVESVYCQSSIFVLSSRFEGFGMVLLEAMACGLPVVSFNCPWGPQSIISDGDDGLLVKNGDVDALANAISHLVSDEQMRNTMSQAAQRNVKRFDINQIADRWRLLFSDLDS